MKNKSLLNWARNSDGTTAIEFALLAIPYLFLTLGIIELALMYASATMLEGASHNAARLVRTGQVQQASADPQAMFTDALCASTTLLVRCEDIQVEVQTLDSFSDFDTLQAQYSDDGDFIPSGFDAGGSSDRVLIRTAYRYQMMTPLVGTLLSGADGATLFMTTIVLQTEPYEFEGFDDV